MVVNADHYNFAAFWCFNCFKQWKCHCTIYLYAFLKEKDDKASLENSIIKDTQTIISYLNKSISLSVEKNQTYDQLIISLFTNYQNILIYCFSTNGICFI